MNKSRITGLIDAVASGEQGASEQLLPLVYNELRKLAASRMRRERPGQTMQPTDLVHEAYLRLVGDDVRWENRRHFFAAASEAMRRIMIDRARQYATVKHGGDLRRTSFDEIGISSSLDMDRLVEWDELLDQLASKDTLMADVIKLRFFGGFDVAGTADALGISPRTVNRHQTAAQAWLKAELQRGG